MFSSLKSRKPSSVEYELPLHEKSIDIRIESRDGRVDKQVGQVFRFSGQRFEIHVVAVDTTFYLLRLDRWIYGELILKQFGLKYYQGFTIAFDWYFLQSDQLCNKLDGGGCRHNTGGNIENHQGHFEIEEKNNKPGMQPFGCLMTLDSNQRSLAQKVYLERQL